MFFFIHKSIHKMDIIASASTTVCGICMMMTAATMVSRIFSANSTNSTDSFMAGMVHVVDQYMLFSFCCLAVMASSVVVRDIINMHEKKAEMNRDTDCFGIHKIMGYMIGMKNKEEKSDDEPNETKPHDTEPIDNKPNNDSKSNDDMSSDINSAASTQTEITECTPDSAST